MHVRIENNYIHNMRCCSEREREPCAIHHNMRGWSYVFALGREPNLSKMQK